MGFKKRKFPARFTGEKDPPGKTGDWGKKVRMGTTAGCRYMGTGKFITIMKKSGAKTVLFHILRWGLQMFSSLASYMRKGCLRQCGK